MEEKALPKPQINLPLPEKELPATTKNSNVLKSKIFIGFVLISTLIAFLIGGVMLGKNTDKENNPQQKITITPTPNNNSSSSWESYSDSGFGFSYTHKYPPTYNLISENNVSSAAYSHQLENNDSVINFRKIINHPSELELADLTKDEAANLKNKMETKNQLNNHESLIISGNRSIGNDKYIYSRIIAIKLDNQNSLMIEANTTNINYILYLDKTLDEILPTIEISKEKESICTQDAKLCPDGSYVGRSGPNCEFKTCPGQ